MKDAVAKICFQQGGYVMSLEFETFLKVNEGRIHLQLRQLGMAGDMYEEFYAEGVVALWQAYRSYDACRGKLGTFLNYRIRYRLLNMLRKKARESKYWDDALMERMVELYDGNWKRGYQTDLPLYDERGIVLDCEFEEFWHDVRLRLSEKQWKWVEYVVIADLSVKEVMELEGVTADAVKGWGREVRRKLAGARNNGS